MIILEVAANRTKILGDIKKVKDDLDQITSAFVSGYNFIPSFKLGQWDGKTHFFRRDSFSTGLLFLVVELLKKRKLPYTIVYSKNYPKLPTSYTLPTSYKGFPLYKHQEEALEIFLNDRGELPLRGILHMATGSGKTACAALSARTLNLKTLFMCHGKSLSKQNFDVFQEVFKDSPIELGYITAKDWNPGQVTCASVDTLYSRLKKKDPRVKQLLQDVQYVITDEAHRGTSASFETVMKETAAPYRMGLSGTPLKNDAARDLMLQALIGPIIYTKKAVELQEEKLIADANLQAIIIDYPQAQALTYIDAVSLLIYNNVYRNNLISKLVSDKIEAGKTGLVICGNSVVLAKNVYKLLKSKYGEDKLRFCYGNTDLDYTMESLELLRQKKINFIISTNIFDEGTDLPDIDTLIIAAAGKSFVKTVQRIGRGLRLKSDGGKLLVIDLFDKTNPYLKSHSNKRLQYYDAEGFFSNVEVTPCSDLLSHPAVTLSSEVVNAQEDEEDFNGGEDF